MSPIEVLKIISLLLLAIIMMVFIFIELKAIFFLNDLNKSLDEIIEYLKSFDWLFRIIDLITDKLYGFADRFSYILNILFKK